MQCICPPNQPEDSRSQSPTQWQQQRWQTMKSQQKALSPNVSYVQCNGRSLQKTTQIVAPQRSVPQRPKYKQQQLTPLETLYTTEQQTTSTPRDTFIGQLPIDSQWSQAQNKRTPCKHCLLHSSAIHRDAFNQKFPGQLPKDAQWASKGHQGPSTTPREAFNTGFSNQLPTDAQWRPQTPASQPSRDVFNVQLPADNRTRPQAISRGPPTQRDVFNEAFIGQLPSDCPQDALGRMAPPTFTPRNVFNQGFVSQLPTDIRLRPQTVCRGRPPSATLRVAFNQGFVGPTAKQCGSRVNRQQVRDPYPGRDVFNEAFVGQLPTDRQPQPPRERKPPTTNYYQSRSKPLCGAKLGQHPTD